MPKSKRAKVGTWEGLNLLTLWKKTHQRAYWCNSHSVPDQNREKRTCKKGGSGPRGDSSIYNFDPYDLTDRFIVFTSNVFAMWFHSPPAIQIQENIDKWDYLWLFEVGQMRNTYLKDIRADWKG
jgi:hypothetical protein